MSRPRLADPQAVVAAVRRNEHQADVARTFGISRVRVNQILAELAPELRIRAKNHKAKVLTPEEEKELAQQRTDMIRFLNAHETRKHAAESLGLTTSGLYSRLRRLGINY